MYSFQKLAKNNVVYCKSFSDTETQCLFSTFNFLILCMYCNVADFYYVTSRFEIPSTDSREEDPSPQRSGSLVFLYYFFFFYSFSCKRKLCYEHSRRRTAAILGYLAVSPSAYILRRSIADRLTIVTTQHPTSA